MEPISIIFLGLLLFLFGTVLLVLLKLKNERNQSELKYNKLLNQKKSSEIVLGQITEKLTPFLEEFKPYDPRQATFLGQPIDYMVFGDDIITFIEVKSGNAKLTQKQRAIKRLVQNGQVAWHEIKIK